jgi:NADH-quinone oxidoreductase subunit N
LKNDLSYSLANIKDSLGFVVPEIILSAGLLLIIILSLLNRRKKNNRIAWGSLAVFTSSIVYSCFAGVPQKAFIFFEGIILVDTFSFFFKILFDVGGILTVLMSMKNDELKTNRFNSEYFMLIISAVLGAHLLAMTSNFLMVFIALELLSISSYVLAGYASNKKGAEGSLKYFLFGSVASAVMLYGFSILFGLTGSLDFTHVLNSTIVQNPLHMVAGLMALAGFLYKIAAVPMHPWAPDVYDAAPIPVIAFLSIVPKLAGIAVLTKFAISMNLVRQNVVSWQTILAIVAIITIGIGNFSALNQNNPKRMMAYSSIAQSGFLLIGIICFSNDGIQFMLFYSVVYLIANFAVFVCLQVFEKNDVNSVFSFAGLGRIQTKVSVLLLLSFIGLAGIPPTAGFTAKLFIFTSLWEAYQSTGNSILIWLLIFGLLNTVISLFYYLKIPYYAFIKLGPPTISNKKTGIENYLALLLVVVLLVLFIRPDLLMGWLNRINFVF